VAILRRFAPKNAFAKAGGFSYRQVVSRKKNLTTTI
jgi:hypothetical protein